MASLRRSLFGDLHAFKHHRLELLDECVAADRDVVELRVGHRSFLPKRPEDVQWVLVGNHANYAKARNLVCGRARRVAGDSVFTNNDAGRAWRRDLNPVMHGKAIAELEQRMTACAHDALRPWGERADLEALREIQRVADRVLIRTMLGVDSERLIEALDAGVRARRGAFGRVLLSSVGIPARLPLAVLPHRRRAIRRFGAVVAERIEQCAEGRAAGRDLLSMLLSPRSDGGAGLEPGRAREELLSFLVAGHHAIGRVVTWTLYAAARDPEVQERIRAESAAADGWQSLRYTRMAVAESLRLFPSTPVFVRVARGDDRLPSGTAVPAGANILLSPYVVQRDPRLYPDPERFDPERFRDGAARGRPRFAYFPFAGGPRLCLGQTFTTMECTIVVAKVLGAYDLNVAPGPIGKPVAVLGLDPPKGLRLVARARA